MAQYREYTSEQITRALQYIVPSALDYNQWLYVGMALKDKGIPFSTWDDWSRNDYRYHPAEMRRKWNSFTGTGIKLGTLLQLAKAYGFDERAEEEPRQEVQPRAAQLSTAEQEIDGNFKRVIENVEKIKLLELPKLNLASWEQTTEFIKSLYSPDEYVNVQYKSQDNSGKHTPVGKGENITTYDFVKFLQDEETSVPAKFEADYNPSAGAWICVNPTNGKGRKNSDITSYKYALIECDCYSLEQQYSIIKELRLPIKTVVKSGKKSIHAIIEIGAETAEEYKSRVELLFKICKLNGLPIDEANKNPSRLTRLAGVERENNLQELIESENYPNERAKAPCVNFLDWLTWVTKQEDDLPETTTATQLKYNLLPLNAELIDGVLRLGHKMLIAGPSKAGKSFMLLGLALAISTGGKFLNSYQCKKGRVLYINLELDPNSCNHRIIDISRVTGMELNNNLEIWNLRGYAVPMNRLKEAIISRYKYHNFTAIIIDPIYKVITGDENSAEEISKFCNCFDELNTELGCAVIYCHHHSKGVQGHKNVMDRASGSGVFARDPDCIMDLTPLEMTEEAREKLKEEVINKLPFGSDVEAETRKLEYATAYRASFVLREFATPPPIDMFFLFPIHELDRTGILADLDPVGMFPRKKIKVEVKEERLEQLDDVYNKFKDINGVVTVNNLMDVYGVAIDGVRRLISDSNNYFIFNGYIYSYADGRALGLDPNKDTKANKKALAIREAARIVETLKFEQNGIVKVQDIINKTGWSKGTVYNRLEELGYAIFEGIVTEKEEM